MKLTVDQYGWIENVATSEDWDLDDEGYILTVPVEMSGFTAAARIIEYASDSDYLSKEDVAEFIQKLASLDVEEVIIGDFKEIRFTNLRISE